MTDTELLDFLADRKQNIAQVLVPRDIAEQCIDLRSAIELAHARWQAETRRTDD